MDIPSIIINDKEIDFFFNSLDKTLSHRYLKLLKNFIIKRI